MSLQLARPRLGPYSGFLLLVLAGLLAYSYIPIPLSRSADPVNQQLGSLRSWSASRAEPP